jgi:NADPH2:quinone reductase
MRAVVFDHFGPPNVLKWRDVSDPQLLEGQALVSIKAAGLNYADVYRRQGNYHMEATPPWILGYEGAGVIVELCGSGDDTFNVGDRVAFADNSRANAELVAVSLDKLVKLPDDISYKTAAAIMLQGLTAQYLIQDSYVARDGDIALVHAAAGGVGILMTQMLVARGVTVVALTSSPQKAAVVKALGARLVLSNDEDWAEGILTHFGRGADVVYESTGSTLVKSMDALRTGGCVVFFGFAGGEPPLINPRALMDRSLTITGGDLWNVLSGPEERHRRTDELFMLYRKGIIVPTIAAEIPMSQAAHAHTLIESRGTIGKILLVPDLEPVMP